jgi:uncharacterized protein (TIGR02246 family)
MNFFRRAGVLAALFIVAASPACAQGQGEKESPPGKERGMTAELGKLSEQWYQAWLDRDAATVERLMADDYVYVAPSGQPQDRAAILRIIRTPSYRLQSWKRTDIVIRPLGDAAAIVRSRGRGEGEFDGKHFKDDHALLQVWSRVGADWKLVLEQSTARSSE